MKHPGEIQGVLVDIMGRVRAMDKEVDTFVRSPAFKALKYNEPIMSCQSHPLVWQRESEYDKEFFIKHAIEIHGLSRAEAEKEIE